jgi:hypothetical protein
MTEGEMDIGGIRLFRLKWLMPPVPKGWTEVPDDIMAHPPHIPGDPAL